MQNKVITIYELIGLIKDGKAPKKIEYRGIIYDFDEKINDYYNSDKKIWSFLYHILGKIKDFVNEFLNDTVEILPEENDEWEDINVGMVYSGNIEDEIMRNRYFISQLIKNQRKIIEKLDDNTCIRDKAELELFINERINEKMNKDIGVNNKL